MKFRRLRSAELQELEADFVQFLAANTVTGSDWEQLKTAQPERAEGLIELFSDIVFEKVIKGVEYLEFKSPRDIKTFHFLEDKIILNGLRVKGETTLDFTQGQDPEAMVAQVRASGAQVQVYTAEKGYQPDREQELFRMMESGALISKDGMLFKVLEGLKGN